MVKITIMTVNKHALNTLITVYICDSDHSFMHAVIFVPLFVSNNKVFFEKAKGYVIILANMNA